MTDSVLDVALEKRFTDSAEITTIDVTSADTLLIRDSATGAVMRLPFATLASAISAAFASSFASLVDGKVPASQLPSFVDDVLEYANIGAFPATGESGKIYVSLATNLTYRWSGSAYVEISASPGSTDAVPEGASNKYFTDARARAAVSASGSLSYNPTTGIFSFTDAVTSVAGKTGAVTLAKSDVGLSNVNNTSDANKPVSTAQQTALNAKLNLTGGELSGNLTLRDDAGATRTIYLGPSVGYATVSYDSAGDLILTARSGYRVKLNSPITLTNQNTASSANSGAYSLPTNPAGFITTILNGTTVKIPYYAN